MEKASKKKKKIIIKEKEEELLNVCEEGKIEEVKYLLAQPNIDPNYQNQNHSTSLYIACVEGHLEIVKILLNDQRVEVNKSKYGETPFWIACKVGYLEIIKLLLNDERVNVNVINGFGRSSFWIACSRGHIEVVKLLLNDHRFESDLNKEDNKNETPFWISCRTGELEIVKLLLNDERIDINKGKGKVNGNVVTPLFIAVENEHVEIVQCILASQRDLDLETKNREGKNIFDLAKMNKGLLSELLKSLKNNPNETREQLRKQLGLFGNIKYY